MGVKILVLDDHESVLLGTRTALKQRYPEAEIHTAQNVKETHALIRQHQPDVLIFDLSIPFNAEDSASTNTGLVTLRQVMREHQTLNIVVQSAYIKALVRLKPVISSHSGGFTVIDKGSSLNAMLTKVDWALQGLMFTPPEMRFGLEIKPEWLEVLQLAFDQGMQDRTIATTMNLSERTVRNYWTKVQDALGVYPEDGISMRIKTEIRAREEGLIG